MHRSSNLAILVVAVILGGFAAFLARSWLQSHSTGTEAQKTVPILVATDTLAFGAPIGAKDVREIDWPAQSSPEGAFANFAELTKNGRRITLSPFVRDEPIISSKVSAPDQRASLSAVIEKGKRAVTVAVDDVRGVAGFIFPGDFVDVALTRTDNSAGPQNFSAVILQHVKVLAIDQMAGQRQEHPTVAKAVTVEVDPDQALRILLAANVGKLSLILRQPAEVALGPDAKVTDRDLFGTDEAQASANPSPPAVQPVAFQPDPPPAAPPPPSRPPRRPRPPPPPPPPPKRPLGKSPSFGRSRANSTKCPKRSNDGIRRVESANTTLPTPTVEPKGTDGRNAALGLDRDARDRRRRRDRCRSRASCGSRVGAQERPVPCGDRASERHEGDAQQIAYALFFRPVLDRGDRRAGNRRRFSDDGFDALRSGQKSRRDQHFRIRSAAAPGVGDRPRCDP